LKIKENTKFFLQIVVFIVLQVIGWHLEGKFSKLKPVHLLFKKFIHLNLLTIILIVGIIWFLLYLYKRFISSKRKLQAVIKNAKKCKSKYDNFVKFISDVYPRRQNPSEKDKMQYLSYHNKLWKLYLNISHPLLEYLREVNKDRKEFHARTILSNIEECFNSSSLEEHFRKRPLEPSTDYFIPIIEKFIAYLKIKV